MGKKAPPWHRALNPLWCFCATCCGLEWSEGMKPGTVHWERAEAPTYAPDWPLVGAICKGSKLWITTHDYIYSWAHIIRNLSWVIESHWQSWQGAHWILVSYMSSYVVLISIFRRSHSFHLYCADMKRNEGRLDVFKSLTHKITK